MSEPLVTALLELDAEVSETMTLCVGGGLGLYLKQLHLQQSPTIRTRFPLRDLPRARTTEDVDLFLRAELVTDSQKMGRVRKALDNLGYTVVPTAKYTQFTKKWGAGVVKIDLLAGPLGEFGTRVKKDDRRVRPRPSVKLHASKVEEALGIEEQVIEVPLSGALPTGKPHQTIIHVPQAFTYLLMKIMAFRDRMNDANKDYARHHALDLYRIVGLLTADEYPHVQQLGKKFADHPTVVEAIELVRKYFQPPTGIGRLRIREHSMASEELRLDDFARELLHLLSPED